MLRRVGVFGWFVFRLSASPFWQTPQKEPKGLAPPSGFSLGAKNSLVEAKFQGHALTGHPWPDSALAASMPLNP
ncbi:hypothetical protein [Pseudomonas sp. C9-3]|uniref:hypothetical protein n=1 Tax=Pseudomonas sp. C9-3 TaxID=3078264 RepID=UPI0028E6B39A|nr:hypothetical protein [Pseudomonas sp. C9-3]